MPNRSAARKANLGLCAVLAACALPIHPPAMQEVNLSVADPIVAGYLMFFFASVLTTFFERQAIAIGSFIALACLSSLLGSAETFFSATEFTLQFAKTVLSFAFFLFGFHLASREQSALEVFLQASLWTAVAFATYSIFDVFVQGASYRAAFPFNNPNGYAAYLLFALAVSWRGLIGSIKPSNVVAAAIIVGGLLATGSRGAIIGAALGLAVAALCLIFRRRRRSERSNGFALIGGALSLAVVSTIGWLLSSQFEAIPIQRVLASLEGEGPNVAIRLQLWAEAWDAFESAPIFGIGLGAFPSYAEREIGVALSTHNTYLSYLAELGIVGFAFFAGFVLYLFRSAMLCIRNDARATWMVLFLFAMLGQAFVTNIDNFRVVWIFAGFVVAEAARYQRRTPPRKNAASEELPLAQLGSQSPAS